MVSRNKENKEAQEVLKKIESFKNLANLPQVDLKKEETSEIKINVDNSLEHGRFFPSHIYPGQWRATEQTFKAMKKNIFAVGEDIDELSQEYQCQGCHQILDLQFWNFCPFCGEGFKQ